MHGGRAIFTIGHSTHEVDTFLRLLAKHNVTAVADIRTHPFSRLPHFRRDHLAAVLNGQGIDYVSLGRELGARRAEPECYVHGLAVYERVATLPLFREGLQRLATLGQQHRVALMCAEREPLDCHRCILVCRHLKPFGFSIRHILGDGAIEEHADTENRLLQRADIFRLFHSDARESDLIEQAYEIRGRQIAYRL